MIRVAVAQNYARALYQVSRERDKEDEVLAALDFLAESLKQDSRLQGMLSHPLVKKRDKKTILQELFHYREGTPEEVLHFFSLMVDKERGSDIEETIRQYRLLYQQDRDIQVVEVYTPWELNQEQKTKIKENMKKYTGREVFLEEKLDTSMTGGVILKMGSRMLDGSLETRLRKMEEWLAQSAAGA